MVFEMLRMLLITAALSNATSFSPTKCGLGEKSMLTRYGAAVLRDCLANGTARNSCIPLPEYPRPTMSRPRYHVLNGLWQWELTTVDGDTVPSPGAPPTGKELNGTILVPFPVESCLSGVPVNLQRIQRKAMWYRLVFDATEMATPGSTARLHFGAADWKSVVYLNGVQLGTHTGGYSGFSYTLSGASALRPTKNELLVWVYDPSDAGPQPMGKQRVGSIASPGGDRYTPSSGIWQTVWIEPVPAEHILALRTDANLTHLNVLVNASTARAAFTLTIEGTSVAVRGKTGTTLAVAVPTPRRLWSPTDPHMYNFTVTLQGSSEKDNDSVRSYFGMRTVALGSDGSSATTRPLLNGNFTFAAGWLDQSWWPDGQYTAPTDEGLRSDLLAAKALGFNMVRLHQKVNPERWYYWADRLGVLVFQDAVQHFGSNPSLELFVEDLTQLISDRYSHCSIVQWNIFNEGDCVKVFMRSNPWTPAHLVHLVRQADRSRLIDVNSGGPANGHNLGDVNDVHDYAGYLGSHPQPQDPKANATQYAMVGEFGGIGTFLTQWQMRNGSGKCLSNSPAGRYGHGNTTPAEQATSYVAMTKLLQANKHDISASVYTQATDVENECDGFLTYDRRSKLDSNDTAMVFKANVGLITTK